METVFITVHDLSLDARIRYCSDSIEDILGYLPHEVKGKSCWEYFHPDEIPFAQAIHGRGIDLDRAAVLNYCRIKHKDGSWVGCECVFTVVHDVLVASTSVYKRGPKARQRAIDGAGVRRIFSSSPRDPRYHMLSYLSNKFYQKPTHQMREPRAALFLNRYTRTSTIMFATNGVANILGVPPDQLIGKSFYYCIAENCLKDAVKCLESAKFNDSIAYLRFWYRDPLQPDLRERSTSLHAAESSDDDEGGGVEIRATSRSSVEMGDAPIPQPGGALLADSPLPQMIPTDEEATELRQDAARASARTLEPGQFSASDSRSGSEDHITRSSSGHSTDLGQNANDAIFDTSTPERSTSSQTPQEDENALEIEAVVSCTSDGLVVILRRAKPLVSPTIGEGTTEPYYANGLFASPWASEPVIPKDMGLPTITPAITVSPSPEPSEEGFMEVIRDVAVFAWSLTGINGSLAQYGRGQPRGESLPPGGLPVWDPNSGADPENRYNGFLGSTHRPFEGMGEPETLRKDEESGSSSDDEILWKRVPTMPAWKRPQRRGHQDAFGADGDLHVDGQDQSGGRKKISQSLGRNLS